MTVGSGSRRHDRLAVTPEKRLFDDDAAATVPTRSEAPSLQADVAQHVTVHATDLPLRPLHVTYGAEKSRRPRPPWLGGADWHGSAVARTRCKRGGERPRQHHSGQIGCR